MPACFQDQITNHDVPTDPESGAIDASTMIPRQVRDSHSLNLTAFIRSPCGSPEHPLKNVHQWTGISSAQAVVLHTTKPPRPPYDCNRQFRISYDEHLFTYLEARRGDDREDLSDMHLGQ